MSSTPTPGALTPPHALGRPTLGPRWAQGHLNAALRDREGAGSGASHLPWYLPGTVFEGTSPPRADASPGPPPQLSAVRMPSSAPCTNPPLTPALAFPEGGTEMGRWSPGALPVDTRCGRKEAKVASSLAWGRLGGMGPRGRIWYLSCRVDSAEALTAEQGGE